MHFPKAFQLVLAQKIKSPGQFTEMKVTSHC